MDLSVAICTYKRIGPLREALGSLSACTGIGREWELLVVDNGGDAKIKAMVEGFAGRLPVRYSVEGRLGTSHARNHAVRRARAAVVLFTDDDVTFERDWLVRMNGAIVSHADCDFWGGKVDPVWPAGLTPPPRWFDQAACPMLGDTIVQYDRGNDSRYWDSQEDPPFYTANLGLRVAAVERVGYFDTTVGHRGGVRMGMEDSLMVKSIASSGGRGWYASDAVVHHPVPAERISKRYARRFAWRQGWLSVHMLRREHAGRSPRWLYRAAAGQMAGGIGKAVSGAVSLSPGRCFAGQFMAVFAASKLWHAMVAGSSP